MRFPQWVVLLLIMLLAVALRIHDIGQSLWLDELHTGWVVIDGFSHLAERAAMGNYGPLYFCLPWMSVQLLGANELALRLPSLLASVALIPAIYLAVRSWCRSTEAALLAATLVAVDPFCVVFGQEARVYALLQLIALLHAMLCWQLTSTPSPGKRAAWVISGAILFHLHYLTGLMLCGELVFLASLTRGKSIGSKNRLRDLLLDVTCLVILILPAWGNLAGIAARRVNWEWFVPRPSVWSAFTIFPFQVYVLLPATLVAVCHLGKVHRHFHSLTAGFQPRQVWFMICWLVIPLSLGWVLSVTDIARVFWPRYFMCSYSALFLFAGTCCAMLTRRSFRRCFAVLVILVSLVTYGPVGQLCLEGRLVGHKGENWRAALEWLNERSGEPAAALLLHSGLIEENELDSHASQELVRYCLFPVASFYPLDKSVTSRIPLSTSTVDRLEASTRELLIQSESIFMLFRGPVKQAEVTLRQVTESLQPTEYFIDERVDLEGLVAVKIKRNHISQR